MKAALLVLLLSFLGAPFQCASDPDPARRMQDTPSEALWNLAERFRERGQGEAREQTLREIVHSYPNSREAERSRLVLHGEPRSSPTTDHHGEPAAAPDSVEPRASPSP